VDEMRTARLRIRPWDDSDRAPFAAMHADPSVMELMPGVLGAEQCAALIDSNQRHFREHGFGLWSLEVVGERPYVGYAGLLRTAFVAPFTPCVEIAWMLARDAWGRGYAIEAARAICQKAFDDLGIDELVAFTVPGNARSRRVMDQLGMSYDHVEDFDHPRVAVGHPLRRHVLYRLSKTNWAASPR
jgi:RimJ/RimL family protein N-acetyltransferase